ncbi:ABC transporter ATP-binding protein [Solemya pervernicosa gill symbiont]|uniref:Probable ATP-binding protein YheS n=2 Tax=Gammaproteobacteria incertae sedis TaxID=118884 RepID=A0A1T2L7S9_9GAMM|nr:ATP-binding cassette domain-containing protein [Candidatus Reidiella endopervernicosa]OOZ40996.1 ABC transporter ATP-binding protein [Solemya pervernicosa gill symbiont]QKQ25052.1 ATP-binding cassette domain-containing protein [Candidatus Reidiella endopervernicosa]
MLKLDQMTLRRGSRTLLKEVDITIHAGQRVGVTGANGCGKSSLFALLRGELQVDEGNWSMPPKTVIAHVAQETPAVERSAIDYAIDGDSELRALEASLAEAEAVDDGHLQATLHDSISNIDGYGAPVRAAKLLHGLGFAEEELQQPVTSFSGGWRMRLNLAQALMCRSDLLLLDEPTNHLDLDTVIWLEEWLCSYPGTLLLISHDRDFLDRVVHHIAHIEQEGMVVYAGGYSDFEVRRAERLAQQQVAYDRQQAEIAHMQHFVDRFRAKATKAKQAQSRLKAMARMELIAAAHVDSPFHFEFPVPEKQPSPLLRLDEVAVGYEGKPIISNVEMTLLPGQRIGLLGHNGAGKSTLIRLLAGELSSMAGEREVPPDLQIGYFAQHQLEQLDPAATPATHLSRIDPKITDQAARNFLGGFGFNGDRVFESIAPFSGGEKARLVLALLVYQRPNLLLLDEPTNHLDLEMRHALGMALQGFEGAMVVVSHDRHLLRSVADEMWLVADGAARPFDGDLESYRQWLAEQRRDEKSAEAKPSASNSATNRKEQKRLEAEQRKQLQPLKKSLDKLEKAMTRLSDEKATIETRLGDSDLYSDTRKAELKELLLEQARVDQVLAEIEEQWLAAEEALEEALVLSA